MLELRVLIYAIILTSINNTAAQSAHNADAEHFNDTTTGFKTTTTTDLSQTFTTTINSIDLSSTTNNNS